MFLKTFDTLFVALGKNLKIALIAFLLAVIVAIGIYHTTTIQQERENCAEERKADKEMIRNLQLIFQEQQGKMLDAFIKSQAEAIERNDDSIRQSIHREIKKVKP